MRNSKQKAPGEKPAIDQVAAFSTAGNYPKDVAGVRALAEALESAACATGMRMAAIVEECLGSSPWCPTPFDLRQVAVSMRDKQRREKQGSKHAEWERIYGSPDPDWAMTLIGALSGSSKDQVKEAVHERAIRDMLFYTEGDGVNQGDRVFWKAAREADLEKFSGDVSRIRSAGGWQTERELQGAS